MQITLLLRTLRATMSRRDLSWAAGWGVALTAVEIIGRRSQSEWADAALLLGLVILGIVTWTRSTEREIAWWAALQRLLRRVPKAFERAVAVSVDLRPDPIPRALPTQRLAWIGALVVLLLLAGAFGGPAAVRALAATAYLPALLLLGLVWSITALSWAAVGGIVGWFVVDMVNVRRENCSPARPRAPYRGTHLLAGPALGVLVAGLSPSPIVPTTVAVVVLAALLALPWFTGHADIPALTTTRSGELRRVSLPLAFVCSLIPWPLLMFAAAYVMASVERAEASAAGFGFTTRAVTAGAACWGAFLLLAVVHVGRDALVSRWTDTAREPTRRVALDGDPAAREEAGARLRQAGFMVRWSNSAERGEVRVVVHPPLDDVDIVGTVERQHRIVQRRLIRRALQRALKAASRFTYEKGDGYLLLPHVGVMPRLQRNEREDDGPSRGIGCTEDVLAPDWATLMPATALHHLREVFRATDVDAIFVEDGVSHRNLTSVLSVVYEVFDVHAGERRVIDRDFVGLVAVRVIVHDVGSASPFRIGEYREPEYENVGRARVLHVFKERGGDRERIAAPAPGDLVPLGA